MTDSRARLAWAVPCVRLADYFGTVDDALVPKIRGVPSALLIREQEQELTPEQVYEVCIHDFAVIRWSCPVRRQPPPSYAPRTS